MKSQALLQAHRHVLLVFGLLLSRKDLVQAEKPVRESIRVSNLHVTDCCRPSFIWPPDYKVTGLGICSHPRQCLRLFFFLLLLLEEIPSSDRRLHLLSPPPPLSCSWALREPIVAAGSIPTSASTASPNCKNDELLFKYIYNSENKVFGM